MTEQNIDPLEAEAKAAAESARTDWADQYFETLAKIDPSPEMARIIEQSKATLAKRAVPRAVNAVRNPATGSYTVHVPKDPMTGKFRSPEPAPADEHPAHRGHEYGGGYARAAALAAGDPDWMNATGGSAAEREALANLIPLDLVHDRGREGFPQDAFEAADRILAAGFHRHPQPTEGEPSDRIEQAIAYIRASWMGTGEPVRNTPAGEIIAILRGERAFVADQGGER